MTKTGKKVLDEMFTELAKASMLYRPSLFWIKLNAIHLHHLSKSGINNFKRSINGKYFSWGTLGIIRHQLWPVFATLIKGNISPLFVSSFQNYDLNLGKGVRRFNPFSALIYRIYVASLYEFVFNEDEYQILNKLKEPMTGNPFVIEYKDRLISEDLCNSVHEFYSITRYVLINEHRKIEIAELGSGYGRLGYIFLKIVPNSAYCFIDIPPALYIAQFYISKIFPKEKIFKFRPFSSFREIKKEFEQSRIRFLMPHQIELLPKKYFDLFINVSSLHEMNRKQIRNYINQADRLCKGYYYTKQWRKSRTEDNNFIKEREYPIPKKWQVIFKRERHPIQNMFFDKLYKIN